MGKPAADTYVDDRAVSDLDFFGEQDDVKGTLAVPAQLGLSQGSDE